MNISEQTLNPSTEPPFSFTILCRVLALFTRGFSNLKFHITTITIIKGLQQGVHYSNAMKHYPVSCLPRASSTSNLPRYHSTAALFFFH